MHFKISMNNKQHGSLLIIHSEIVMSYCGFFTSYNIYNFEFFFQEKRDVIFGQLFAYTAIVRSGRLSNHNYLSEVVTSLLDLCFSRSFILNTTYEVFVDLFSQVSITLNVMDVSSFYFNFELFIDW